MNENDSYTLTPEDMERLDREGPENFEPITKMEVIKIEKPS